MKYPNIIFFRHSQYGYIDEFLNGNKDKLLCTINPTDEKESLNKLFDPNYHLLVTFGNDFTEYANQVNSIIAPRMLRRWLHFDKIEDIDNFNKSVNYCYIHNVTDRHENTRPVFSVFTTCYKSYNKIKMVYESMKEQTLKDWEWVILDDSPDDSHFDFLRDLFKTDRRIRLYKGRENNGSIGNVKNEVVSLCRGKYVLELDHDDEILPNVLKDSANVFDSDPDVGFVYMDFSNIYENGGNFNYGDWYSLGYAGYYMQWYKGRWIYVSTTANINNVTLTHIVSVPNHPRIWRKDALLKMGNYSEMLPISDDYELLLRTAVSTKIVKIHKLGYIQYMNDGGNNFSLIRNSEINRLCIDYLRPMCFEKYKINEYMNKNNAYQDDQSWDRIWLRENFEPKYINKIVNVDHKKQYAVIGRDTFYNNMDKLKSLYEDPLNDFLVLDNKMSHDEMCKMLEANNFFRMKCYSLKDTTIEQLVKFFMLTYKSCDDYEILQ